MTAAEARRQRALKLFGGPAGLAAVEEYVQRIVDAAPPLSLTQKARIRTLLRASPHGDADIRPLRPAARALAPERPDSAAA